MRLLIVIVVCFIIPCTGFCQRKVSMDSSPVNPRSFNLPGLQTYKNDRQYQYEKVIEPPVSWIDRLWFWVRNWLEEMLSTENGQRVFSGIIILLASAILIYTILKLTGMSAAGLFGSRNKGEPLAYSAFDENIHTIPFEEAIDKAIGERNYRLAVRLLYLQSLKLLTDRHLINWQINKTNINYLQELQGTAYENSFNNLTRQFEKTWYGRLQIEDQGFRGVREEFTVFNQQLHKS